jgi:tetratricopeptide (TPR) repeat protein
MILLAPAFAFALQTIDSLPPTTAPAIDARYRACLSLATSDPKAAENEAESYRLSGGGAKARECLGLAYAQEERWREAATSFEGAAHDADAAKDKLMAKYWAEAGNAWLAASEPVKAHAALDAALAPGTLAGQDKGEALLDRSRALVAAGEMKGARVDLDGALDNAPADPLAWLLSATLARRMGDLPRAKGDIAEALRLSADDASVQLEAGNIAAMDGNADGARAAWQQAVKLAPGSPMAANARKALTQFDAPEPAPAAAAAPAPTSAKK